MVKLRIKIDRELCIGAASCVTVAPLYFALNQENKAFPKNPSLPEEPSVYERVIEVSDSDRDAILLAAQSCPTLAIFMFDEDSGEQLFPQAYL